MIELHVYDPALCCSTGVCGPEVDPVLVRFAADLEWLRRRGVEVRRYNLAQEPNAFAGSALVRRSLQQNGTECLPLLASGGAILSQGRYPLRDELAAWTGVNDAANEPIPAKSPVAAADSGCCAPTLIGIRHSKGSGGRSPGCC